MKKIMRTIGLGLCLLFLTFMTPAPAVAALAHNQNITAIFGGGNPDTGWTTATDGNTVVALRAKERLTGVTANISGVYNMPVGYVSPGRAAWQVEWSANSGNQFLTAYDYYLVRDSDPSTAVNYSTIDFIAVIPDNSFGTSLTPNGMGIEPNLLLGITTAMLESTNTIAQQSHNIGFYPGMDADLNATYNYQLFATLPGVGPNGARLATTEIKVIVGTGGLPPPDSDGDGVPNSLDLCPGTIAGHAVDVNGCSVQDLVNKCAADNTSDDGVLDHGEYVSCVVETANNLFKAGTISKDERKLLINGAAQSSVGK